MVDKNEDWRNWNISSNFNTISSKKKKKITRFGCFYSHSQITVNEMNFEKYFTVLLTNRNKNKQRI